MLNRGGANLNHIEGYKLETEGFEKYEPVITRLLSAEKVELITRSVLDTECGIDAIANIQKQHYFVSLRFRQTNKDYNSFTTSRHITTFGNELKKWLINKVRPDFFIQITEIGNSIRIIEVNVDSFILFVQKLIKDNTLQAYWNENLKSYEFKLDNILQGDNGIRNYLVDKSQVFT